MGVVFAGMAASLDGFIASKTGDLSWLNDSMARDEDYGFEETERRTGAYVMGAITYREVAGMGGGGKTKTYVVTHESPSEKRGVEFYSGELRPLVERIKSETDKDICVFGGGDLTTQFIEQDLLDELTVSIVPVLLGDGVPFFRRMENQRRIRLQECTQYPSGIVILTYQLS